MSTTGNPADIDLMDLGPFQEGAELDNFDVLRQHDPVHWNDEAGDAAGFWSLTRYADVQAGASDNLRLSSADGTQIVSRRVEGALHSMHNMDDPEHAKLRRILVPHLRAVKVKHWQDVIDESVRVLLDDAERLDEFELTATISARLPMLVLSRVLGVPAADAPRMVDWTNRLTSADSHATVSELDEAREEVMSYFQWLTEQRRADPQEDLISVLVSASKDGEPLTWGELAAYYIVLVAAGNETTRHLVSGGIAAMHDFAGSWDRLESTPSLLPTAVEEMFRFVTPLGCMRRTALVDLEIGGQAISAGDKVVLWFSSANRDPEMFLDPHSFVLDRSPNEHLTFGWGIHACIGSHLARAEVTTLFDEMLKRRIRLDVVGPRLGLRHNVFRGISELPVRIARP